MRTIIIATGKANGGPRIPGFSPDILMPLVDRPFIQHVVEYLVDRGVRECDFILCDQPERVEHLLGNGERWGARFRFHLTGDPHHPYDRLKLIVPEAGDSDIWLIGHGNRLPALDAIASKPVLNLWHDPSSGKAIWTGWATLSSGQVAALPDNLDRAALEVQLRRLFVDESSIHHSPGMLSVESHRRLLHSQQAALSGEFPGLFVTGREIAPQVRVGRNSAISARCRLISPVFIGENCRIEAGAIIGPNAVIGEGSVIDHQARISNSLVIAQSYVGESLSLKNVVAGGRLLTRATRGHISALSGDEPEVTAIESISMGALCQRLERLISPPLGLLLTVICSPLLALTAICCRSIYRGPVWRHRQVLVLPASTDRSNWRTFRLWGMGKPWQRSPPATRIARVIQFTLLEFIPRLRNVSSGDLHLFGVRPRTPGEIDRLPGEWRSFCLARQSGWIFPALIHHAGRLPDRETANQQTANHQTANQETANQETAMRITNDRAGENKDDDEDPLPVDLVRVANRLARRYAEKH